MFDFFFFFQAEDGIRDSSTSRGLGDVYKRQLVTRQLVTRTADPHDGRAHLIALTVLGQQQANEIRQVMANWWAALFAATPKADAQTTSDQLAAIYETLQNRLRGTDASR
ncbi:Transcriptional regulator [Lactobacillus brevis ATCC 367] [Lactiplantibacillus mudanjiangensis]|nr:Transcriptional regulator [Lactobacillus brevis ATCC 367] [Lactiplantibacillus mudanjiangensis]